MFKEKIAKLKEKVESQNKDGNNKKKIENLVVFVIILIVTVVVINYIWSGGNSAGSKNENNTNTKTLASVEINDNKNENTSMETKLENILANIKGVGDVNVLITYSQTSQIIPVYDEDTTQTTTEETDSSGGNRTVNENSSKKEVVYEENDGTKKVLTQSTINPTIEGAVITAKGASDASIKANIIQAVEAATGLATHKIQVFEKQ